MSFDVAVVPIAVFLIPLHGYRRRFCASHVLGTAAGSHDEAVAIIASLHSNVAGRATASSTPFQFSRLHSHFRSFALNAAKDSRCRPVANWLLCLALWDSEATDGETCRIATKSCECAKESSKDNVGSHTRP